MTVDSLILFNGLKESLDHFFLVTMGIVVFFMQAGFALLEAGSVRSKNTTNILLKNILDSLFGCISYWLFGFAFAFGGNANPFCGTSNWALSYVKPQTYSFFFFQYVFAATAATIVSGAVAERCEFIAYIIYSCFITGFLYPIVTHWAWADQGWLKRGITYVTPDNVTLHSTYQDFAGSGVVHVVGGTAALIACGILGPRIGRFDTRGKLIPMPGHSISLISAGAFILFFGFFAFNGGSQLSISNAADGIAVSLSVVNTIISGSLSATVCLIIRKIVAKSWSLLSSVNGGLAGMVAICAGCNAVYPWGAAVIGTIAGLSFLLWDALLPKMKIDDPLSAFPVHFGGGIWGVLSVAFLNKERGILFKWDRQSGLDFAWQLVGLSSIFGWTAITSIILFGILKLTKLFRVHESLEIHGMDCLKHSEIAYPEQGNGFHHDGRTCRSHGNVNVAFQPDSQQKVAAATPQTSQVAFTKF